jgi:tetratricopeptide (TPR) repeat protein
VGIAGSSAHDGSNSVAKSGNYRLALDQYLLAMRLYALVPEDWMPEKNTTAQSRVLSESLTLYNAARYLEAMGSLPEAEQGLNRSIALSQAIPVRYPGQVYLPFVLVQHAQALSLRGMVRYATGREKEAQADYEKARDLFARITPAEIGILTAFPDLARLEQAYGICCGIAGRRRRQRTHFAALRRPGKRSRSPRT